MQPPPIPGSSEFSCFVLVVSRDDMFRQQILSGHGDWLKPLHVESIVGLYNELACAEALTLIDLDSLGGIATCLDQLLLLRRTFPRPTMLLSKFFKYDDLSCERAAICDVSLRWPCSKAALAAGRQVAFSNYSVILSTAAGNERVARFEIDATAFGDPTSFFLPSPDNLATNTKTRRRPCPNPSDTVHSADRAPLQEIEKGNVLRE